MSTMKPPKRRKKLERYILRYYGDGETKQSSLLAFAEKVGVSIHETRKWLDGNRSPREERKRLIEKLTKGAITLYDW